MITALWIAVAVSLGLSAYAALSVLLAQLAGYRALRRPLPKVVNLPALAADQRRRSAAARKGWDTRRRQPEPAVEETN